MSDPMRADVYIAAMPRSGSTAIANLMTASPWRLMLVEPWISEGAHGAALLAQLRRFGWSITDAEYDYRDGEPVSDRMKRLFGQRFAALDAWGCKEVVAETHTPTIALLRPHTVLIVVRHLYDVALSLIEMSERQKWQAPITLEDLRLRIGAPSRTLTELATAPHQRTVIVRYEDFVTSAECRSKLQQQLAWGFGGSLDGNNDLWNREYEQLRHGTGISADFVSVEQRELPSGAVEAATTLASEHPEYHEFFGYT